jgi:DNA-binding transcriptional LysR family regulator
MKKLKLAALMENQETIKRSVSKGMGVTILSKLAAEEELKNGTLLAFPLGSQGGKRMINLVYDAEYPLLPAAERFIKMIKRMYLKKENTGIGECK